MRLTLVDNMAIAEFVSSINNRIQNTVNANNRDFQSETRLRLTNAAAQTAPRAV